MAVNDDKRRVEPGSCTWCGHRPHETKCTSRIRVGKEGTRDVEAPCPCTQHEWAASRRAQEQDPGF